VVVVHKKNFEVNFRVSVVLEKKLIKRKSLRRTDNGIQKWFKSYQRGRVCP